MGLFSPSLDFQVTKFHYVLGSLRIEGRDRERDKSQYRDYRAEQYDAFHFSILLESAFANDPNNLIPNPFPSGKGNRITCPKKLRELEPAGVTSPRGAR